MTLTDLEKLERERDEARAEVERLKGGRGEAMASLAALKQEYRPADELRTQLLVEMEAHAETRSEVERLRGIVEVNDLRLAAVWDEARAEVERLKAERDEAWDRVDNLEGVIRDNIPYAYDQGEPDEDEANPEECVEYAAKEIAVLKKENERLRGVVWQVRALSVTEERDYRCVRVVEQLREIHEITKGMVE